MYGHVEDFYKPHQSLELDFFKLLVLNFLLYVNSMSRRK